MPEEHDPGPAPHPIKAGSREAMRLGTIADILKDDAQQIYDRMAGRHPNDKGYQPASLDDLSSPTRLLVERSSGFSLDLDRYWESSRSRVGSGLRFGDADAVTFAASLDADLKPVDRDLSRLIEQWNDVSSPNADYDADRIGDVAKSLQQRIASARDLLVDRESKLNMADGRQLAALQQLNGALLGLSEQIGARLRSLAASSAVERVTLSNQTRQLIERAKAADPTLVQLDAAVAAQQASLKGLSSSAVSFAQRLQAEVTAVGTAGAKLWRAGLDAKQQEQAADEFSELGSALTKATVDFRRAGEAERVFVSPRERLQAEDDLIGLLEDDQAAASDLAAARKKLWRDVVTQDARWLGDVEKALRSKPELLANEARLAAFQAKAERDDLTAAQRRKAEDGMREAMAAETRARDALARANEGRASAQQKLKDAQKLAAEYRQALGEARSDLNNRLPSRDMLPSYWRDAKQTLLDGVEAAIGKAVRKTLDGAYDLGLDKKLRELYDQVNASRLQPQQLQDAAALVLGTLDDYGVRTRSIVNNQRKVAGDDVVDALIDGTLQRLQMLQESIAHNVEYLFDSGVFDMH